MNQQQVSTFLTAGHIKFMLLHGGKSEDSIKNFFNEVYELYVKVRVSLACVCVCCNFLYEAAFVLLTSQVVRPLSSCL